MEQRERDKRTARRRAIADATKVLVAAVETLYDRGGLPYHIRVAVEMLRRERLGAKP